jgi:hypothetical protein
MPLIRDRRARSSPARKHGRDMRADVMGGPQRWRADADGVRELLPF